MLGNLIQNVIRYTKQGGVIAVARTRRERTSIEVGDSGIGIAEEELPKVSDEFYQVDNSARDRARGIDATASVRDSYGAPLPAILITGDTSAEEEVKRAHDSGHRVLFKPVRTRELYAALRSVP